MTTGVTAERLRETLDAALHPVQLSVTDDSHLHAGHAGARAPDGHLVLVPCRLAASQG